MKDRKFLEVGVENAALIGETCHKDQVVIVTWARAEHSVTVTTWGKNIHDADQAAEGGNKIKQGLGWPEEKCKTVSAKVVAVKEDIQEARSVILDNLGLFGGGEKMNRVFDILNRAIDRIDGKELTGE